jgi:hypothetical protein
MSASQYAGSSTAAAAAAARLEECHTAAATVWEALITPDALEDGAAEGLRIGLLKSWARTPAKSQTEVASQLTCILEFPEATQVGRE